MKEQNRKRDSVIDVGQRIKDVRIALRMQQKDMAAKLGTVQSYLSEIESGKANPGPDFFLKLSHEFNVNLNYVFLGIGDMFFSTKKEISGGAFDFDEEVDSIEKVVWLMENCPFFKSTIFSFSYKTLLENEAIIKKSIKKYKSQKSKVKE